MDLKDIHKSKLVRAVVIGVILSLAIIFIFEAGVFVGYRKAAYSFKLGDNYYQTFRGGRPMNIIGIDGDSIPGGHGATGRIVRVTPPTLVIADDDNVEKTVLVSTSTAIRRFQDTLTIADIKDDEYAVVLGSPDTNGVIIAKFIRLLPPPPQGFATDTNMIRQ